LNLYYLWYFRQKHQQTDRAFRDTDCEFSSIFRNVLDGILIADNGGNCLDANPAAIAILRSSALDLVGKGIRRFFADEEAFADGWNAFLKNKRHRGHARLTACDGTTVYVDFMGVTNYLPGRHVLIFCDVTERTRAESSLKRSEERFQHMANNIQEVFWMMDARTQEITYVNRAYNTITGYASDTLSRNPIAYRELIHPEDRIRILSRLKDLSDSGTFDEECRFIRADGELRWAWTKGFPVQHNGATRWLVGTVQDITSRKQAEMQIATHLDAAERARAEAEVLRKSTLALSQNLAMDSVLDTLLQCISELVPYDVATVLFAEESHNLMVARVAPKTEPGIIGLTLKAEVNAFLAKAFLEQRSILLPDVTDEAEWKGIPPFDRIKSWLGVPLIAGNEVLGILSLGALVSNVFTPEHLRLAKSLAIPASVAIKNARTHERAEIYAAELEINLQELRNAQRALKLADCTMSRSTNI
jgi:PAS domain S-box-containing protein